MEEVQDVVNVDSEAVSVETETFVQSKNSETVVKNTANQAEEISEATAVANEVEPDQHFSDIIADYYAKKQPLKRLLNVVKQLLLKLSKHVKKLNQKK